MGPSVSFPLPLKIAQKSPNRNSWKLTIKKLPIPLPLFYYFEVIWEALANTLYIFDTFQQKLHDTKFPAPFGRL